MDALLPALDFASMQLSNGKTLRDSIIFISRCSQLVFPVPVIYMAVLHCLMEQVSQYVLRA